MVGRNIEDDIVQKAWIELSRESIFYSYFKMKFENFPTQTIRTIKLGITANGNFRLIYNPKRLLNKGLVLTKGLIKHEIYHLMFGHIFIKQKNKREKGIWDLCMDAAINQYIPELDSLAAPLDVMLMEGHAPDNENFFVTCPIEKPGLTAEEYFRFAMNFIDEKKIVDLEEIIEDRDKHSDSHNFENEIQQEMAFDIVNEFIQKSYDKSSGEHPQGVDMAIKILRNKPKFNWQTILRRFFGSSTITDKYRTFLRPNRRYDDQPGWKTVRGPKIVVIIDTSGSIIDEEYNQFFGEIESISNNLDGKVKLIQADNKIQKVIEYNRGNWKDITLKGKGSTDLQTAIDFAESNYRPEGVIIFTDGWLEVPNVSRRVLFVLSSKHNVEFYNQIIEYYSKNSIIVIK